MDQAARGAKALASGDFTSAVSYYTEAISLNPTAVDYYIKRSTAYTRLSPPNHELAFKDAEIGVSLATKRGKRELIAQGQLRRAIALLGLERYANAKQCLQWVKKYNDKEKTLAIWEMKVDTKLKGLEGDDQQLKHMVEEIPNVEAPKPPENDIKPTEPSHVHAQSDGTSKHAAETKVTNASTPSQGVQTPANKIRHEWYQSNEHVVVTLFCKGIPKDKASVQIKERSLEVSFPLPTGSAFDFTLDPLFSSIDRMKSYYKIMSTKAEFTLMKMTPGQKWLSIEAAKSSQADNAATADGKDSEDLVKRAIVADNTSKTSPAYPTSSKSGPKDWDKLSNDLLKRPKKTAKDGEEEEMEDPGVEDEEGDPTNNFFKMLYGQSNDDTRRAMMKSYQESNGTALSTNWEEVSKGPVETHPPDGLEAKKWET